VGNLSVGGEVHLDRSAEKVVDRRGIPKPTGEESVKNPREKLDLREKFEA